MKKEKHILSLGWRSHWLARELSEKGYEVHLYDVTSLLGAQYMEDINGPFPLSMSSKVATDFNTLFNYDISKENLPLGLSLIACGQGLSWKSPNFEACIERLKSEFYESVDKSENFWLEDFLKSFAKVRFKKSSLWSDEKESFDVTADFAIRRSSFEDFEQSLSALEQEGVVLHKLDSKTLNHVLSEIKKEFKKWILALTVSELKFLTDAEPTNLDGSLGWHRKRFYHSSEHLKSLPAWSVHVSSPYKPWKENNLSILIKGEEGEHLDLWTVESVYRYGAEEEFFVSAHEWLKEAFPYLDFRYELSQGFGGSLKTLFPVTSGFTEINDNQYYWNSPREWGGYETRLMYEHQKKLLSKF